MENKKELYETKTEKERVILVGIENEDSTMGVDACLDELEELIRKQKLLGTHITTRKLRYNWHEAKVSRLEAIFARGDRRLSAALLKAREEGFMFDGWDEYFSYDKWMSVFESCGIDTSYYANRRFEFDEILPWSHISCGVSEEFLLAEAKKAREGMTTPDCRSKCSACGMQKVCEIHRM